jgi:hypothetical protein
VVLLRKIFPQKSYLNSAVYRNVRQREEMYLRDLQITLRVHDFKIYPLLRDGVWEPIEILLYSKIPKKFLFGGVKKVVIQVGAGENDKEYSEALGIGVYHYPNFIASEFLALNKNSQHQKTIEIIRASFQRLEVIFNASAPWLFEELDRLEKENA